MLVKYCVWHRSTRLDDAEITIRKGYVMPQELPFYSRASCVWIVPGSLRFEHFVPRPKLGNTKAEYSFSALLTES